MAAIDKDVHLTIEFCAFVHAGYYGLVRFDSALDELKSGLLPQGYTDGAHKALDKLDGWLEDAGRGLPIFSVNWQAAETFDAISSMNFLRDLKKDITSIIPQLDEALQVEDYTRDPESLKLLVASIVRSAAVRYACMETLVRVYQQLNAPNLAQQAAMQLNPAKEYVDVSLVILRTFAGSDSWSTELCEKLRREALLAPGDFRCHTHDANILLNVFFKEFTWEMAEFSRGEAQEWENQRIPPVAAGYWRAYRLTPADFLDWQRHQISAAPVAANWMRAGYNPDLAIPWIKEGFAPSLALIWDKAGFEPAKAASFVRRGIMDPSKAPDRNRGDNDEVDEF
jgi:hypothetical protein